LKKENFNIDEYYYLAPDESKTYKFFEPPKRSEWKCYLFGNDPKINDGIMYNPKEGYEPNWFVRWMMKVCFACTWVKEKDDTKL
jgi:hypothetical protein